jgi:Tissue inhibitor of metalloproteinase
MMTRPVLLACLTLASFLLLRATAVACTCLPIGPACQAFWTTDAVFDATVEAVEPVKPVDSTAPKSPQAWGENIVKLSVRQSWKGVGAGPVEVVTADNSAACGYQFKPGRRYLVFASKRPDDGRWSVSLCSGTREFDGTGDSAAFLASLSQPPSGGRIFGSVRAFERRFDPANSAVERPVDAVVRLLSGGSERRAVAANGRFEFAGLEAQRYRLELELPDGFITNAAGRDVEIANPQACAEEDYRLTSAGRIIGHLLTANGRPAAGVRVEVTDPDVRPDPAYGLPIVAATADTAGDFEIIEIPPGRYIVGINLLDLPSNVNQYARTLYPSVGTVGDVVSVGTGGATDLGTWRLPPPLGVVKVEGVAALEDGSPAAGFYVGVRDVTGNPVEDARGAGGAMVDGRGHFVLELRQGRTYTFMARDKSSALLSVRGPRLVVGTEPPAPVRLVVGAPIKR